MSIHFSLAVYGVPEAMAAPAATALTPYKPRHSQHWVKFSIADGFQRLTNAATAAPYPFDWDGSAYPELNRSSGPDTEALDQHSDVLIHLVHLTPNGCPDPFLLRDLLIMLHWLFGIF